MIQSFFFIEKRTKNGGQQYLFLETAISCLESLMCDQCCNVPHFGICVESCVLQSDYSVNFPREMMQQVVLLLFVRFESVFKFSKVICFEIFLVNG